MLSAPSSITVYSCMDRDLILVNNKEVNTIGFVLTSYKIVQLSDYLFYETVVQ